MPAPQEITLVNDLPEGEHFTQSRTRIKPAHAGRKACKANTGAKYTENNESSQDDKCARPKVFPVKTKPSVAGPFKTRVKAQNSRSQCPSRCLPPVPSNSDDAEDVDNNTPGDDKLPNPVPRNSRNATKSEPSVCGIFKTESHTLKKLTSTRKYWCRMCREGVDSTKELLQHHQTKHGIAYCKICQKAFNNPLLLARHNYEHKTKSHKCDKCEESFPFASQLKTHSVDLIHQRQAKHYCVYPGCGRKIKNKPDLNRHAKCHTSKELKLTPIKRPNTKLRE